MHELSIAVEIVSIVEKSAKENHCRKVTSVDLEIGLVSGVEPDALQTALEYSVKDTMLEQAVMTIHEIPGRAVCLDCHHEFGTDLPFMPCPSCSSVNISIVQGKEMRVKTIKAE